MKTNFFSGIKFKKIFIAKDIEILFKWKFLIKPMKVKDITLNLSTLNTFLWGTVRITRQACYF